MHRGYLACQTGPSPARAEAFTLIELLFVIAIIAILAGLILTALSRAKAAAVLAQCRGNVRQLNLALAMYAQDYGLYPFEAVGKAQSVAPVWSHPSFIHYLGASWPTNNLRCPSRAGEVFMSDVGSGVLLPGKRYYGINSQGYMPNAVGLGNGLLWKSTQTSEGVFPVRESEIVVPSDMIALGDPFQNASATTVFAQNLWRRDVATNFNPPPLKAYLIRYADRQHGRRGVVGFCDGHLETLPFKSLFLDYSEAALRRWNRDHISHRFQ
jgi:prepilin-type N-terminal cleavage/methylation domain-containing protein/prepilin-type processing-associated H-X9-DG protein